ISDRIIAMASSGYVQAVVLLLALQLVCLAAADADHETGTVIPAESRPCVDCHAFEFMQRALQDLKKTAFNLDARVSEVLLSRMLCRDHTVSFCVCQTIFNVITLKISL
uniref:NELL2-interacting cell ontogeny regulator 1 n=1 Tax=Amphilophus citrinellus TaxID=61819 RepID=A0A3Q0SQZ3_AMPCI